MQWLEDNQLQGKVIEIKTKNPREYFILSSRLEKLGITESITLNGKHYGVEVKGLVFDNLIISRNDKRGMVTRLPLS